MLCYFETDAPTYETISLEQLQQAQMQDDESKALRDYIIDKKQPSNKNLRRLVNLLKDKILEHNKIVWVTLNKKNDRKMETVVAYTPPTLRPKILEAAHSHLLSGHAGIQRTTDRILSTYFLA